VNDGTKSANIFMDSVRDLEARLAKIDSPRANELAGEARRLAALFTRWQTHRPDGDERVSAIKALFELQRGVMSLLSARPP
jgi:hypothetical protein